jgi:hypothetical protein
LVCPRGNSVWVAGILEKEMENTGISKKGGTRIFACLCGKIEKRVYIQPIYLDLSTRDGQLYTKRNRVARRMKRRKLCTISTLKTFDKRESEGQ